MWHKEGRLLWVEVTETNQQRVRCGELLYSEGWLVLDDLLCDLQSSTIIIFACAVVETCMVSWPLLCLLDDESPDKLAANTSTTAL